MAVSIVVPVKNAGAYIRETIESALAQSQEVGELIVVDDGSADNTRAIVGEFGDPRVKLLVNDRRGVSAARNLGARSATSEWLMFLDADDRLKSGAIGKLARAAALAPEAVAVYGGYVRIDEAGRTVGMRRLLRSRAKPSGQILSRLAAGNFIVNGGVMIVRSTAFAAVGGFDEGLRYCEDWHCWCRLAAIGEFKFVPEIVLDYRVHSTNTMSTTRSSLGDYLPAADRVFSDPVIVARLPADVLPSLRSAADVHLITYAAMQAIRFRQYRAAMDYVAVAARLDPRAAPAVILHVGLAYFGF